MFDLEFAPTGDRTQGSIQSATDSRKKGEEKCNKFPLPPAVTFHTN